MEDKDRFKETYEQLIAYIKDRFDLMRLQIAERSVRELAAFLSKAILGLVLAASLVFLSIALSLYLGSLWGRYELGFAIVGAGYFFLFLLLALFRRPILQRPFMNKLIQRIFKEDDDE